MASATITASLAGTLYQFNHLLSRATLKHRHDQLYLQITDDKLVITNPMGEIQTYCTATSQHLHSIETREENPTLAIINVEEFHDYLNLATSKMVFIDFLCESGTNFASEAHIKDDLKRTIGTSTPSTAFQPERAVSIANMHGINPDILSNASNGREAASILYRELVRSVPKHQGVRTSARRTQYEIEHGLPVTEMRRLSPMQVYEWVTDDEFLVEYPKQEIADLQSQFDHSNRLFISTKNQKSPAPATVLTTQGTLEKVVKASRIVGANGSYLVVLKGGGFWLEAASESGAIEGWLAATNVTGPALRNEYGPAFEIVVHALSGDVELQTGPESKLAFVQRDSGLIVRHLIDETSS